MNRGKTGSLYCRMPEGGMTKMVTGFPQKIVKDQDPVVQSIVSLTSSLRGQLVKCFTTL